MYSDQSKEFSSYVGFDVVVIRWIKPHDVLSSIVWFNPPYSDHVKTNIGRELL